MTLNQLYYFRTIAKYENYHQAAEELYISQPSLSRSIAALEEEFGVKLFQKDGRGIVLTKAGNLFLEYTKRILAECEIAKEKMIALSGDGGRIDIAYVFPLASHFMPHHVRAFLDEPQNKNVTFRMVQGNTAQVIERLKEGQVDIGFGGYEDKHDDMEFFPILNQEMVIIVPKNHQLAEKDFISISALNEFPVIGYERKSFLGKYTAGLYRRMNMNPNIAYECPDENAIQAWVREGFGIAIVPKVDTIDETSVKVLRIEDASLSNCIFMIWKKDQYQLPATQRFIDYMKSVSNINN